MKQLAVQQNTFQACLKSFVEATNKRFNDLTRETAKDAAELKGSLQFTQKAVDNIKNILHEKSDLLDDPVKRIEIVASVQHEIENGIDYLENQRRRNNLRIDGVAERDFRFALSNRKEHSSMKTTPCTPTRSTCCVTPTTNYG